MHVIAIHQISDPSSFWAGQLDLPNGTALPGAFPNADGTKGVCVWESDSVDTVRNLVEGAFGEISDTEYYAVDSENARGLPS